MPGGLAMPDLEVSLAVLDERRVADWRVYMAQREGDLALAEAKAAAIEKALEMAAAVEHAHFELLNGHKKEMQLRVETFLPAATYEKSETAHAVWQRGMDQWRAGMLAIALIATPLLTAAALFALQSFFPK